MRFLVAMQSAMLVQGGASISEAVGTDGYNYGNSVVSHFNSILNTDLFTDESIQVGYGFQSSAGVDAAMWKKVCNSPSIFDS